MAHEHGRLSLTDRELLFRLGWFTRIRWVMGGAALLILLVSWYVLGVRFRSPGTEPTMSPAVNVVLVVFLYNAAFAFIVHIIQARAHVEGPEGPHGRALRVNRRLIVPLALGQLTCDMIAVVALAHFTGGVENFFLVVILVPLVIATELLPQSLAYATAAAAVVLVNALAWGEQQGIIPHVHADWPGGGVNLYTDRLYVFEVTGGLTLTIFAMVFVASSISKRLRLRESELEEAYRALSLADEAKSFFMRKAGHEMRAPLAAIHSILDAVAETCEGLSENHCRLIKRAQKRMRGLMVLVDDMRHYSRLRTPEVMFSTEKFKPLELGQIVRETVELFRQKATSAGVKLSYRADSVRLEGGEELLREMVTNLVSNAVQYTPAGGRVRVRLRNSGHEAALRVSDTGIGISPEAWEGLFEEFHRSPEARQMLPEGTGLGLAITRRIVEMHGGRITYTPHKGGGSVFIATLPLRRRTVAI